MGKAVLLSKFDLMKGYWQIQLTGRAKKISTCVTSKGLFLYKVMPFGLKNSAATFQRMMVQGSKVQGIFDFQIPENKKALM